MSGWIKLHREILKKAIWKESTSDQRSILVTLLLLASHEENEWLWKGEKYKVQPGQFVTSLPSLAEKVGRGVTIQMIRTALLKFEKLGFLTDESTNKNRLITIVNWESYQSDEEKLTGKLTGNQQAPNRQLTAIKNDKNDKNNLSLLCEKPIASENENSQFAKDGLAIIANSGNANLQNFNWVKGYLELQLKANPDKDPAYLLKVWGETCVRAAECSASRSKWYMTTFEGKLQNPSPVSNGKQYGQPKQTHKDRIMAAKQVRHIHEGTLIQVSDLTVDPSGVLCLGGAMFPFEQYEPVKEI